MRNMAVDPNINIAEIARLVSFVSICTPISNQQRSLQSEGCSGAEMTALCQEAAILTMQRDMNAPFVRFKYKFRKKHYLMSL